MTAMCVCVCERVFVYVCAMILTMQIGAHIWTRFTLVPLHTRSTKTFLTNAARTRSHESQSKKRAQFFDRTGNECTFNDFYNLWFSCNAFIHKVKRCTRMCCVCAQKWLESFAPNHHHPFESLDESPFLFPLVPLCMRSKRCVCIIHCCIGQSGTNYHTYIQALGTYA